MSSLQAAATAVNAHGGNAVDVSYDQPAATPPPAHTSPPVDLPPCPECRGELLRYQNRETDEDELLCLDCWWSVPTAAFIRPPTESIDSAVSASPPHSG
jgi:hypothetical protein